jgi:hypothetical protein
MAKTKMICPFSGKLCKECPLYRGRHYYLCFAKKYRGHLEDTANKSLESKGQLPFKDAKKITDQYRLPIPPPLKPRATWLSFNDFPDRKKK